MLSAELAKDVMEQILIANQFPAKKVKIVPVPVFIVQMDLVTLSPVLKKKLVFLALV
jgi:hypothetical protein